MEPAGRDHRLVATAVWRLAIIIGIIGIITVVVVVARLLLPLRS
jgi:hypothetical protein